MHKLPDLPYDFNALEPSIDARTMEIHHGKHHNAYVSNLNNALEAAGGAFGDWPLEKLLTGLGELPEAQRTAIRNNGGGHFNHTLFWTIMGKGGGKPSGDLAGAIDKAFGDFGSFQDTFSKAAVTRFGSGWAWLSVKDGELVVSSTPNQDNPVMDGSGVPILGLDVWEHAYYLHYQNRRPEYVKAWWEVVNWDEVARRYAEAVKQVG
jgi:Fe-Mn family superoxide dismutase